MPTNPYVVYGNVQINGIKDSIVVTIKNLTSPRISSDTRTTDTNGFYLYDDLTQLPLSYATGDVIEVSATVINTIIETFITKSPEEKLINLYDSSAYRLQYITNGVINSNIISYVGDFKLERELEKLLDKCTFKISRSIDNQSYFIGFNPNVELLLTFNNIGIFRGRVKTANKKYYYEVESYSSAEILSRVKAQKIYENTTPEAIFTDLIQTYSDLTPITVVSGTTVERLVADEYVSSIVTKISEALGWSIYTDSSKNIYLRPRGNVTNSTVIKRQLTSSNAIFGEWKKDHNELCNDIRITGDNVNYNTQQIFTGDGSTREYIINEQPINIKISIDNIELSFGNYIVYPESKKVILNNAPSNGSIITIDYSYSYPIHVAREDTTSITSNERFTKILFLKWLKTRADIITYANNFLTTYKEPLLSNNILMNAAHITSFTPGEQVPIIDDIEGYNSNYVINKIKLEYLKGTVELNVGSYIPIFVNTQGTIQDRIKELEKNLSKSTIQLYSTNSESMLITETLTESDINYINFKIDVSNRPKCNFGRGTTNDARVGLCQS